MFPVEPFVGPGVASKGTQTKVPSMATTRRKALPVHASRRNQLIRAATSPAAKATYAVVGTVGLAALAIAIFGPKRFQKEILAPVQNRVTDQASQLWTDAKPVRAQIAKLFERAQTSASREKLAQGFQSWIGHFKAT